MKIHSAADCRRRADQHWEMAGLARLDGDNLDADKHIKLARLWEERAAAGGYEE